MYFKEIRICLNVNQVIKLFLKPGKGKLSGNIPLRVACSSVMYLYVASSRYV